MEATLTHKPVPGTPFTPVDTEVKYRSQTQSISEVQTEHRDPGEHSLSAVALKHYLEDPEQYETTRRSVESARQRLLSEIGDAVTNLLSNSHTPSIKHPNLESWQQSPLFYEFLSEVYGNTTPKTLLDVLSANHQQTKLNLGQMMQVMLTAAISFWVLKQQHKYFPRDPTETTKTTLNAEVEHGMPILSY